MITGLVSDGVWSKLDALYIFATVDRTTAVLNLVSSSFSAVEHGTISFSAYHGYTGDGSTFFLDTQFTPLTGGTNYLLNSASLFAYNLSFNTTENKAAIGVNSGGGTNTEIILQPTFSQVGVLFNGGTTNNVSAANSQGFWVGSATSTQTGVSKNGAAQTLISATPSALPTTPIYIFAQNSSGAIGITTDQFSAAGIGGTLTNTDISNLSNRINTYMTAYRINVY